MSMLTAQIDRLRSAAQTYRTLGNHELEQALLDAADTIVELRGALLVAARDVRCAEAENEKLRELVRDMFSAFIGGPTTAKQRADMRDRMRELGVEFDG